jgi:membrane protein
MSESRLARLKARASTSWTALRDRWPWLRHMVAAWQRLQGNNGNQYAAAITYFSFLALFPLLLLAVAIIGFFVHGDPSAEQHLLAGITNNVPGPLGETLRSATKAAIDSRASLGIVGLLGVLFTGLGWVGNVRAAVDAVWGREVEKVNFVKAKLANLFVLGGLGVASVLSIGLTVVGTTLTDQMVRWLGLDGVIGAGTVVSLLGIALAVAGDMIIFWWLLVRLPQIELPVRIALKGALVAAAGFEVLKVVGSYTIAHTANSPTAGPFAGVIAILIWIQLVARWLLLACAWTAVLADEHMARDRAAEPVPPPAENAAEARADVSPTTVGMTLVGAGMIAGAAATWALTRPHPDD